MGAFYFQCCRCVAASLWGFTHTHSICATTTMGMPENAPYNSKFVWTYPLTFNIGKNVLQFVTPSPALAKEQKQKCAKEYK